MRLACARHLRDLEHGGKRGLVWRPDQVDLVFRFIESFCTIEGGLPMRLTPDQQFIVGSLFGWWRKDGRRRFETSFWEGAKGSAKSPTSAACLLALLFVFSEPSAEILCAANTEDQANIVRDHALRMIEDSPALLRRCEITKKSIFVPATRSVLRAVSAERRGLDGKRPSAASVDEIQEYKVDTVLVKIRKGSKGRKNPLFLLTCNAGYGKESPSWRLREYGDRVLREILVDDTFFVYVPTLDPCEEHRAEGRIFPDLGCAACDDFRDPKVWKKANPTLGVTIQEAYLKREVNEAIGMPSQLNQTLRLNFNIWTEAKNRWLPMFRWDECKGPHDWRALRDRVRGRPCLGGMDLAQVSDMSSFSLFFPELGDDPAILLNWYWVPEENIRQRSDTDGVHYDLWRDQGLLEVTPGDVTDYRVIRRRVRELAAEYQVGPVGYDRRFAAEIVMNLRDDGLTMIETPQSASAISWACREFERIVKQRSFWHGGHPILRWNASNATVILDADNQIRLDKSSETERIDGVSAAVFAIRLRATLGEPGQSIWSQFTPEQWAGIGAPAEPDRQAALPPPTDLRTVRRKSIYASDAWKQFAKDHGYL